ncbi:head scaffolding protein [Aeromonas phage CF7]|uniref:Putative scaffolding protein n=1 Tax=Aeromonas phage CF7 TaxID=2507411 RepID=A0A249XL85_9CAUD|nr:head scaffolding protein [Aeromonas phage CF7]ASZ71959.1 putative scaffolding protein [Aeromonas phage CF7]
MLFRNQALKYMNAAGADGAEAGGGIPGVQPGTEPPAPTAIGPGAAKAAEDAAKAADAKAAEDAAKAAEAAKKAEADKGKTPENTPAPVEGSIDSFIAHFEQSKPALSLALTFLKDAGITANDPAFKMAESSNDFTLLEAVLAQKGLPGTEQMVAILKAEAAANAAALEASQKETDELVQSILGEDTEAILGWAVENATADECAAIDDMLGAGGVYARAAATMLQQAYSGANVTVPSKAVPPTKTAPSTQQTEVTARVFAEESQKLYAKYGPDFKQTQEYAKLSSARAAVRAKGR